MKKELTKKQQKFINCTSVIIVFLLLGAICWFVGKPMVTFVSEPEKFRSWIDGYGIWGQLIFILMVALQVIIAFIPGEPFEICAGYAFGSLQGTVLCMIGFLLGSAIIYAIVKYFGVKFVEIYFSTREIKKLKFLKNEKKIEIIAFILMMIPGTPKDLLSYFLGLTKIHFWQYMLIIAVSRIPSLVTSTIGGNSLGEQKYVMAGIIFSLTLIVSLLGLIYYKVIVKSKNNNHNGTDNSLHV